MNRCDYTTHIATHNTRWSHKWRNTAVLEARPPDCQSGSGARRRPRYTEDGGAPPSFHDPGPLSIEKAIDIRATGGSG